MSDPKKKNKPAGPADPIQEVQELAEQETAQLAETAEKETAEIAETAERETAQLAGDPVQEVQELTEQERAELAEKVSQAAANAQEVQELAQQERDALTALLNSLEKELNESGSAGEILRALSNTLAETAQRVQDLYKKMGPFLDRVPDNLRKDLAAADDYIKQAGIYIDDFCGSDKMESLQAIFPDAREWIESERAAGPGSVINLATNLLIIQDSIPIIRDYVDRVEFHGTFADFMRIEKDPDTGASLDSPFELCLLDTEKAAEAAEAAKVVKEKYPLLSPVPSLSNYAVMNDKAANELIKGAAKTAQKEIDGQISWIWGVDESGKNTPGQVPIFLSMTYMGSPLKTSRHITSDDMAVFEGLCTPMLKLKLQGETYPYRITPEEIWRNMNGIKDDRQSPTKKQRAAVCASIDKMRYTELWMDLTYELNAHYLDNLNDDRVTNGYVKQNFLYAEYGQAETAKGKAVYAYEILKEPFLLTYFLAKGHVLFVDYSLLDTSDTTGNEGNTVAFRRYLLQQIALMYRKERDNTNILYSTIYQDAGIETPEERAKGNYNSENTRNALIKKLAAADRKKINAILDSWVNKKWINGYEQTRNGRAYKGVNIILNPVNFTKDKTAPIKNIAGEIEQKKKQEQQEAQK